MDRLGTVGRRKRSLLTLLISAVCVLAFAPGAMASSIVFAGIDAEDGGPGGHGPIDNYCQLVNSMLDDVDGTQASKDGILVLGSKGFGGPSAFWTAIAGCVSEPVTQIGTAPGIAGADLSDYQMIAVVSSATETSGGLEQSEQDALLARASEITDFVNAGGALLGFSQTGLSNPYQYVGGVGSLSVNTSLSYSNITPTAAGLARGIGNELDVCCWHDSFNDLPAGFDVLAFVGSSNDAAAIGTGDTVSTEICNDGVDNDGDGKIDGADPDCVVVVPENCNNGVDDDGDGLVDIDDPDCQDTEGPAGDPSCSDGIDNDNDGKVDAADPDCDPVVPGSPPKCFGQTATIYRGSGYPGTSVARNQPMTIDGTSGDDVIVTENGADVINGRGGDDLICSRGGADKVRGEGGNDFIHSDNGADDIGGGAGDDQVLGGKEGDAVNGGSGTDKIRGQDGNDTLNGGEGDGDRVYGDAGSDKLAGNEGVKDLCAGGADVDKKVFNNGCEIVTDIP